jgi:hypothetical protein
MADGLDRAKLMERVRVTRSVATSLCGAAKRAVIRARARVAHSLVVTAHHRTVWEQAFTAHRAREDAIPPLPDSPSDRGA